VLEGLRGEDSIAELCRKEGINQNLYYRWSKEFLEAGKKRLAGDTVRIPRSTFYGREDATRAMIFEGASDETHAVGNKRGGKCVAGISGVFVPVKQYKVFGINEHFDCDKAL
jgi:hypothetical protein